MVVVVAAARVRELEAVVAVDVVGLVVGTAEAALVVEVVEPPPQPAATGQRQRADQGGGRARHRRARRLPFAIVAGSGYGPRRRE